MRTKKEETNYLRQLDYLCQSVTPELLFGGISHPCEWEALIKANRPYWGTSDYRALILHKETHPPVIPIGIAEYLPHAAKYVLPSGATVQLSRIDEDADLDRYRGEYDYLGFYRLSRFTEKQYLYLHPRLRSISGFTRIRAVDDREKLYNCPWIRKYYYAFSGISDRIFFPCRCV